MTTNRLAVSSVAQDAKERITPPKDPQERINFWIARGNALLEADGKHHLHWVWASGSYSIEPRPTSRPLMIGRE